MSSTYACQAIFAEEPEVARTGWRFSCDELILECKESKGVRQAIEQHIPLLKDIIRIEEFYLSGHQYDDTMLKQQESIERESAWKEQLKNNSNNNNSPPKEKPIITDPTMILLKRMNETSKKPENTFFVSRKKWGCLI